MDALPDGVRFVRATSSQGICESGVSCQLGNMALDATSTITVVGVVASDVATGTTLVNLARAVDAANPDTNPSNNASSASMMVTAEALMSIVKEVAPSQAKPGATVTYRIVVTNSGPSTAANVVVADSVPAQLQNVLVSSSAGGCSGFPCVLGNLAPDGSATILVAGVVAQSVTSAFTNTASLSTGTALAKWQRDQRHGDGECHGAG